MKPLVAVAALVLVLSGCAGAPAGKSIELIGEVDFSQSQAVLGFDDQSYVVAESDPELQQFKDLLEKHDIEPWNYTTPDTAGCAGGVTTSALILYDGESDQMDIDGCAAKDGSFEAEATALFSRFREAHQEFTPKDIVAIEFSQTQAVQGFDDSVHRQEDPAQLDRFRELIEGYNVQPGQYPNGTPCPGSIATDITVYYQGEGIMPVLYLDSCTDDGGFSAAATDLFSEWRTAV